MAEVAFCFHLLSTKRLLSDAVPLQSTSRNRSLNFHLDSMETKWKQKATCGNWLGGKAAKSEHCVKMQLFSFTPINVVHTIQMPSN
jgi:hypothetical protein